MSNELKSSKSHKYKTKNLNVVILFDTVYFKYVISNIMQSILQLWGITDTHAKFE